VTGAGRLLDEPRIPRVGPGRPRTTPTALRADKAYAGPKNRALLQARGITVVIPEKSDAIARRKAKGSVGGRPLDFDAEDYKNRNVVERAFNKLKNWRGLATRYDKFALTYRGSMVLASIVLWLS
jgi:transposase